MSSIFEEMNDLNYLENGGIRSVEVTSRARTTNGACETDLPSVAGEFNIDRSKRDSPEIAVIAKRDLTASIERYCKPDVRKVAQALVKALKEHRGMTFDELREETKLGTSLLNHALISMRNWGFVEDVGRQRSKIYYITEYGYIVYLSFDAALASFNDSVAEAAKLFKDR